jgi:hypothetical protein
MHHTLTGRTRLFLLVLLLVLVAFTAIGLRALLLYNPGPLLYGIWALFTGVCAAGVFWLAASFWRGRLTWRSYFPVADVFTVAAAAITVLTLVLGLRAPSDPASALGVLYAFTLLVICIAWSLHNRIAAAELAAKEHLLRIEYRLADLASRVHK